MYHTMQSELRQEQLHDITPQGKERPWRKHKAAAQLLAQAYMVQGQARKAARVLACADSLHYQRGPDGRLQLVSAAFCRVRLCPICQWRRSLKVYGQTRQIVDYLAAQAAQAGRKPPEYIMLTLTIPNVPGSWLPQVLTHLHRSWQRLCQLDQVQAAVRGWMRATEITYNSNNSTYHPHIHAVLCVPHSYFTGRTYIRRDTWLTLWRQSTRQHDITQVDVRRAYGNAAAEIAKYAAKPSDYLDPSDVDRMDSVLATLDAALAHRRFVSWGGCMAAAHSALSLDDADDGDLLHTGVDETAAATAAPLISYDWTPGPRLYLRRKEASDGQATP